MKDRSKLTVCYETPISGRFHLEAFDQSVRFYKYTIIFN